VWRKNLHRTIEEVNYSKVFVTSKKKERKKKGKSLDVKISGTTGKTETTRNKEKTKRVP